MSKNKKNKEKIENQSGTDFGTSDRLVISRVLMVESPPMQGDDIKGIQALLIKQGYHCGISGACGTYNESTAFAVRMIQAFYKCNVNGIVDEKTATAIGAVWETAESKNDTPE